MVLGKKIHNARFRTLWITNPAISAIRCLTLLDFGSAEQDK